MKPILILLFASILIFSGEQERKTLPTLNSTVENIEYEINGKLFANWKITPNLRPDRLMVECGEKGSVIRFFSDIDTIKFNIKNGDTLQFNVLFQKDTALTEIVGIPKNVHYSDEYIKMNKGKFNVKIPEVHELANVMVAISNIGQVDSNMVDMTTKYHKEVLEHFLVYKNHPAIDTINSHIIKAFDNDSYWYYYALKMNACGYLFNEKDEIINDGIINKKNGFNNVDDPFVLNKELFEDFSKKSNFRKFYREHQNYFDDLITTYKILNPIDQMQKWLEKKFGFGYGNYLVTFSPLVGGAHSTQRFEDNGFNQTVMFVNRSEFSEGNSRNIDEMNNSRIVFTEIDHNFVNPVSDRYRKNIEKTFMDRSKWVNAEANGASAYGTTYAVFNEYMTFAFYSLYCMDSFPKKDVEEFLPLMESKMVEKRGFINFKKFNQKMLSLYKNRPDITVDEIYVEMLNWSEKE